MNKKLMSFVLAAALLLAAATPALAQGELVQISAKALSDHECDSGEWHFVITQVALPSLAPASIHVRWANGASADVSLWKFTGGVAHYVTTANLDSTVASATAWIYAGWSGEFNLSHGPCGSATPTNTPTTPPNDTPTPGTTPTNTPTLPGDTPTPGTTPTNTPTLPGDTPTPENTPTGTPTLPGDTPTPQLPNCENDNLYRLVVEGNGNIGVVRLELSEGGPYADDVNGEKPRFELGLPDTVKVMRVYLNDVDVSAGVATDDGLGLPTSASRCTQRVIYLPDPSTQPTPTQNPVNLTGAGGNNGDGGAGSLVIVAFCVVVGLAALFSRKPKAS